MTTNKEKNQNDTISCFETIICTYSSFSEVSGLEFRDSPFEITRSRQRFRSTIENPCTNLDFAPSTQWRSLLLCRFSTSILSAKSFSGTITSAVIMERRSPKVSYYFIYCLYFSLLNNMVWCGWHRSTINMFHSFCFFLFRIISFHKIFPRIDIQILFELIHWFYSHN